MAHNHEHGGHSHGHAPASYDKAFVTAIGSAFATGGATLGTFLVLGFTLHNITEGIGIVAPLVDQRPRLPTLVALAGLAGLPAVAGI